jgi:hypothetical protein
MRYKNQVLLVMNPRMRTIPRLSGPYHSISNSPTDLPAGILDDPAMWPATGWGRFRRTIQTLGEETLRIPMRRRWSVGLS